MAWLEQDPSQRYHVCFRFAGSKFRRSLKTTSKSAAETRLGRLEENIQLVESGRLEIPTDADVAAFLLSDGKLNGKAQAPKTVMLSPLFDQFFKSLPESSLEQSTINCMEIHRRHLERHLGKRFRVRQLSIEKLQTYVKKRSQEPGRRGRTVGANTIKKELVTLRTVWRWAVMRKLLDGEFPDEGLRLPKDTEKPPFQTWKEIERQIGRGGLSDNEQADLWDCLFLTLDEIDSVLEFVRDAPAQPFVFPMFAMAAQTGARRSELMRSQLSDFDDNAVLLRERKRVRGKRSFRRVPLSESLRKALDEWFKNHPGGVFTFCKVAGGHTMPLTRDDASGYFDRTLDGSVWSNIPGWHCFRHSFISNCAMKGVDQRIIDTWVGHQTDEMRRRYRHLFPDTERTAMQSVFS